MSRQHRFDWFSLRQRQQCHSDKRKLQVCKPNTASRQRRPRFETLEMRELLSVNAGQLPLESAAAQVASAATGSSANNPWLASDGVVPSLIITHDHNGDGIADHSAADHEAGCCCDQCLAAAGLAHDHNGDGIPDHASWEHETGCCCEQCTGIPEPAPGTIRVEAAAYYPAPEEGQPLPLDIHTFFDIPLSPTALAAQATNETEVAAATSPLENPPTVILDFIDIGEANSTDLIGNVVSAFEINEFGFATNEFDTLTELILEDVRSDFLDIATSDVFAQSPIDPGWELNIQFEIGNVGDLPTNGSNDFYYVQVGTGVSGGFTNALGVALLGAIRNADGTGAGFQSGEVISSVFTDTFENLPGLNVPGALSTGNFELTANAISRVISHEVGHAVSLNHVSQQGIVTPSGFNGFSAILGTGAIDTPNQALIEPGEFSFSGFNPELGNQQQFHLDQLVGALGLVPEGTSPRATPDFLVSTVDDENDGDFSEGDLSLREALELAAAEPGINNVGFDLELAGQTIQLDQALGSLFISESTSILGLAGDENQITIVAPNSNSSLGVAGGGQIFIIGDQADPISLDADAAPTFETPLTISNVQLNGTAATNGFGAVFSTEQLSLQNVVIQGSSGASGGAVFATAGLEIVNSEILNNSADVGGAIHVTGNLTIENSTISGNAATESGGAVYADATFATVLIESSNIVNNTASLEAGGALLISGEASDVDILRSTISGNIAGSNGGGIAIDGISNDILIEESTFFGNDASGNGGGLHVFNDNTGNIQGNELLVLSSTISGNTASGNGGGIDVFDFNPFQLRILHSTVFDNQAAFGGGTYLLSGSLLADHSIIAGNRATSGSAPDFDNINPNIDPETPPTLFASFSLIGTGDGANIENLGQSSLVGGLIPIDPGLGPLEDNGGLTLTHEPLLNSPVIEAGNPTIPFLTDADQRGFDRIINATIDIGAVESDGLVNIFTVDTLVDEDDGDSSAGDLSLREAIDIANNSVGSALINFAAELDGGTIFINSSLGEFDITSSIIVDAEQLLSGITVDASTADSTPDLDDGNGQRLFNVDDGDSEALLDFELRNITLEGGDVDGSGGAIFTNENLTLVAVTINDNAAAGDGGGIFQQGGGLFISGSTIANNRAVGDGSTGQSNGLDVQPGSGGGLWTNTLSFNPNDEDFDPGDLRVDIVNSTFSGNTAASEGGGIFNFNGLLAIQHTTITDNAAPNVAGGGVVSFAAVGTRTEVFSSIISGNSNGDVQVSLNAPALSGNTFESQGFNLIGDGNALLVFSLSDNDVIDTNPGLLPLSSNGGPTPTHALLPGSPAVDASDPTAIIDSEGPNTPEGLPDFDQRGQLFSRIIDADLDGVARLDIGSFEASEFVPSGDFNNDNQVDGADFLSWQRSFGSTDPITVTGGDADFDGDVDADDLQVWIADFGTQITTAGDSEAAGPSSSTSPAGIVFEGQASSAVAENSAAAPFQPILPASYVDLRSDFANTNDEYSVTSDYLSYRPASAFDAAFYDDALDRVASTSTAQRQVVHESDETDDITLDPFDAAFEEIELSGLLRGGDYGV